MTPGPKFSSSTSAFWSSARKTSWPRACFRLSVRLRLLALNDRKNSASSPGRSRWEYRATSPLPGSSTLITSAPNQASIWPHDGPAWLLVRSTTRMPASALSNRALLALERGQRRVVGAGAVAPRELRGGDARLLHARDQRGQGWVQLVRQRAGAGAPDVGHEAEPGVGDVADQQALRVRVGVEHVQLDLALPVAQHMLAHHLDDRGPGEVARAQHRVPREGRGEHAPEMRGGALAGDDGGPGVGVGPEAARVVHVVVREHEVLHRLAHVLAARGADRPRRLPVGDRGVEHDDVVLHLHDQAIV